MAKQGTIGICAKRGQSKIVRDHHINGYLGEHINETAPYCYSCDKKAHKKARREGRCKLSSTQTTRLSHNSSHKRNQKQKTLHMTIGKNIEVIQKIYININTGHLTYNSSFYGNNNKKLYYLKE